MEMSFIVLVAILDKVTSRPSLMYLSCKKWISVGDKVCLIYVRTPPPFLFLSTLFNSKPFSFSELEEEDLLSFVSVIVTTSRFWTNDEASPHLDKILLIFQVPSHRDGLFAISAISEGEVSAYPVGVVVLILPPLMLSSRGSALSEGRVGA